MLTNTSDVIRHEIQAIAQSSALASRTEPVNTLASLFLLCASVPMVQPASAQDISGQTLEQITVTASKREESIQDVPISMAALTSEQLEKQQIRSAADLAGYVSNLTVNLPVGDAQPVFSIRGINTADFALGQNSPVAVYYDEVYKGTSPVQGVGLFDLARVEVLKGPQGTLYGKNTTGGAINFVSRVPDFTNEANATLSYGNFNAFHAHGGAQTSVTETVAVRLAFTFDQADGWLKNVAPGEPDLASTDNYGVRATLLFRPSDRFNATLRAFTSESDPYVSAGAWIPLTPQGVGYPMYPATGANGVLLEPEFPTDPYEAYTVSPHHNVTDTRSFSLTANYSLSDDLDLLSITSWDNGEQRRPFDGFTKIKILQNSFYAESTQFAQDLRLTSQFSGPFNFILGAYYNREDVSAESLTAFLYDIDVNLDGVVDAADCVDGGFFRACSRGNDFDQFKESVAVYTDGSYDLSDSLRLRAGLRYTIDKGDLTGASAYFGDAYGAPIVDTFSNESRHYSDNDLSGRFGLDYNVTSDIMLYATYSRGYRGASFNNLAFSGPEELNIAPPETVTLYELGWKTELFSNRVRFNGAVFYMDYKDQQVLSFDPETSANLLVSLGSSEVKGGELELDVQVTDHLKLFSSVGVLDAKIKEGEKSGVDVSGKYLIGAPDLTASAGVEWAGSIGEKLHYDLNLDGTYTGRQYFDLTNNPLMEQGGYTLLNGRIRFSDSNDKVGVSLWAKNLTDKEIYHTISYTAFVGSNYVVLNMPRTYGVSIDAKFE